MTAIGDPVDATPRLRVDPSASALGLTHVRAWVIRAPFALLAVPGLDESRALDRIGAIDEIDRAETAQGHSRLLTLLGYPATEGAAERAQRALDDRGWQSYGGLVDAVQVITLRSGLGLGVHRLPAGTHRIEVRRAGGEERMCPAFSSRTRRLPVGDLSYGPCAPTFEPHAWLGKRDCDAASGQLTPDDRAAYLLSLGYPGVTSASMRELDETLVASVLATHEQITVEAVTVDGDGASDAA